MVDCPVPRYGSEPSFLSRILDQYLCYLLSLLLFGTSLGIYISTLPPGITWENNGADSGELAAAVFTLGVAHPPGYPTFILLGKLFSFIPVGEVAYRTNLMSAVLGSATVVLLYLTILNVIAVVSGKRELNVHRYAHLSAAISTLGFMASPLFWSQAIITEVYALNAFMVAGILFLLTRRTMKGLEDKPGYLWDKHLIAAALFLGLGLGNHLTVASVVPTAVLLLAVGWKRSYWRTLPAGVFAFILGLGIYAYLPISALRDPPVNWGQADTVSGFWFNISGTPYRQFTFSAPTDLWTDRLTDQWPNLAMDQFFYLGIILGVIGVVWLWGKNLVLGLSGVLLVVLLVIYAGTYRTPDSFVYLIPGFFVFAIWVGLGLHWLTQCAVSWLRQQRPFASLNSLYRYVPALVLITAFGLIPLRTLIVNYSDQDLSNDTIATRYADAVLDIVEPGALLLADTDPHIFSLWYTIFVRSPQTDITLVTQNLLLYDWYAEQVKKQYPGILPAGLQTDFRERLSAVVRVNLFKRPIYLTDRTPSNRHLFQQFDIETIWMEEVERPIYLVRGERRAP